MMDNKNSFRVALSKDTAGDHEVFLENSQIKVKYGMGRKGQSYIQEFSIKKTGRNMAGSILDASAHRREIRKVKVLLDGEEEKRVRMEWNGNENWPGPAISEVSVFPDSKYIRIKYISFCFHHIAEHHPLKDPWGTFKIYGYEKEDPPQYEDCFYWEDPGKYGCTGCHAHKDAIGTNAASHSYKGWFIIGVYDKKDGNGYGRVMPVSNTHTVKLLFYSGFELFLQKPPFTGFLFAVTEGADEVIELGKKIVDEYKD